MRLGLFAGFRTGSRSSRRSARRDGLLGPLPVETVYFWPSTAGMPDDLARRHVELLAGEVAPALRAL
jgi:hypothetical protein